MSPILCTWIGAIILGVVSAIVAAPIAGGLSFTIPASAVFVLLAMAIVHAVTGD